MSGTRVRLIYGVLAAGALASFAVVYWWIAAMGLLLGMLVATVAVLVCVQQMLAGGRIAYVHGYHAGYHAGADVECFGPDCELVELTRERMAEITSMASAGASFGRVLEVSR